MTHYYYTVASGLVVLTKAPSVDVALDQIELALVEEEICDEILVEDIHRVDSRDTSTIINPTDF